MEIAKATDFLRAERLGLCSTLVQTISIFSIFLTVRCLPLVMTLRAEAVFLKLLPTVESYFDKVRHRDDRHLSELKIDGCVATIDSPIF